MLGSFIRHHRSANHYRIKLVPIAPTLEKHRAFDYHNQRKSPENPSREQSLLRGVKLRAVQNKPTEREIIEKIAELRAEAK